MEEKTESEESVAVEAKETESKGMSRRAFLKGMSAATLAGGAVAAGAAGFLAGTDPASRLGWEVASRGYQGAFDRRPFEVDRPLYRVVNETRRPPILSFVWTRRLAGNFSRLLNVPEGMDLETFIRESVDVDDLESVPFDWVPHEGLRNFYHEVYQRTGWNWLADDLRNFTETNEFLRSIADETRFDTFVSLAFFNSFTIHVPANAARVNTRGDAPREENSDYRGVNPVQYSVKDPAELTKLVKQVALLYGSSVVRVAKLNPDFCFAEGQGTRGYGLLEPIEIPDHWVYGIVIGAPHEWDTLYGNPLWGTSHDAYSHISIAAARLAEFIKRLGFPARENSPNAGYEWVLPPIMVDCGMGEQGRMGVVISPDLGPNLRPAMVVTNMPLIPDKPIDMNIGRFCRHCKICAEQCPSGSISFEDNPKEIGGRGYEGWSINTVTCHTEIRRTPSGHLGCRLCIAVCPFAKKHNWLQRATRNVIARDPTGLSDRFFTWMEGAFYGEHAPEHFIYTPGTRRYGAIRGQPWFLDSSRVFNES